MSDQPTTSAAAAPVIVAVFDSKGKHVPAGGEIYTGTHDQGDIWVCGSATPGATLRIENGAAYLGAIIADSHGRWAIQVSSPSPRQHYEVKAGWGGSTSTPYSFWHPGLN